MRNGNNSRFGQFFFQTHISHTSYSAIAKYVHFFDIKNPGKTFFPAQYYYTLSAVQFKILSETFWTSIFAIESIKLVEEGRDLLASAEGLLPAAEKKQQGSGNLSPGGSKVGGTAPLPPIKENLDLSEATLLKSVSLHG